MGDITANELKVLLDKTFGVLPERDPKPLPSRKQNSAAAGEVIVVQKNNPQSRVLFGQKGLYRDDPELLMPRLCSITFWAVEPLPPDFMRKSARSAVWLIRSSVIFCPWIALRSGLGGAGNRKILPCRFLSNWCAINGQISELLGVTQDELDKAKANLIGSFGLRFDNSSAIAGMLVAVQRRDLGIEYINERNALIEQVTLEDVNGVAKTYSRP